MSDLRREVANWLTTGGKVTRTRIGPGRQARLAGARGRASLQARELAKALLNYHGQRRPILRRYLFDAVGPFTPSLAVERGGITYFVSTADKEVGREVFGKGGFAEEELSHAVMLLQARLGRRPLLEGKTFVDVGANIGTTVIPAVRLFGAARGIAIEPEPANMRLLRCNLIANDLVDRVQCHELALSDRSGSGLLERSGSNSGDNRLRLDGQPPPFGGAADGGSVPVTVTTFDDLLRQEGISCDDLGLVWMDAQGHEARILAGASTLTHSQVPVVIEYWPWVLRLCGELDALNELVAARYDTVMDLRASITARQPVVHAAANLPELASRLLPSGSTDLILLPKGAGEA